MPLAQLLRDAAHLLVCQGRLRGGGESTNAITRRRRRKGRVLRCKSGFNRRQRFRVKSPHAPRPRCVCRRGCRLDARSGHRSGIGLRPLWAPRRTLRGGRPGAGSVFQPQLSIQAKGARGRGSRGANRRRARFWKGGGGEWYDGAVRDLQAARGGQARVVSLPTRLARGALRGGQLGENASSDAERARFSAEPLTPKRGGADSK